MSFERHGDGHAAIRLLLVIFVVLALSGCGSDQTAASDSSEDQGATTSPATEDSEAVADDESPDDGSQSGEGEDAGDNGAPADDDEDEQVGDSDSNNGDSDDGDSNDGDSDDGDSNDIDPDDIELNPDAVNPPDKTTPAVTTPAQESYDSALEPLVQQAKTDLGSRLGVDSSTIAVRSAVAMTWPDASAGCPRPGMAYAQVITDGTEIVLMSEGGSYRYTTGGALTAPALCEA